MWCHWSLLFSPLSPNFKGQGLIFHVLWPILFSQLLANPRATFFKVYLRALSSNGLTRVSCPGVPHLIFRIKEPSSDPGIMLGNILSIGIPMAIVTLQIDEFSQWRFSANRQHPFLTCQHSPKTSHFWSWHNVLRDSLVDISFLGKHTFIPLKWGCDIFYLITKPSVFCMWPSHLTISFVPFETQVFILLCKIR